MNNVPRGTIGQGIVDVVATEGFSGNIALKSAEGTARQLGRYLKDAMARSIWSKLDVRAGSTDSSFVRLYIGAFAN